MPALMLFGQHRRCATDYNKMENQRSHNRFVRSKRRIDLAFRTFWSIDWYTVSNHHMVKGASWKAHFGTGHLRRRSGVFSDGPWNVLVQLHIEPATGKHCEFKWLNFIYIGNNCNTGHSGRFKLYQPVKKSLHNTWIDPIGDFHRPDTL